MELKERTSNIVNKVWRNKIDEIIDSDWLLLDVPWFLGRIIPLFFFSFFTSPWEVQLFKQMQPFDDPLTTKWRAHGYWSAVSWSGQVSYLLELGHGLFATIFVVRAGPRPKAMNRRGRIDLKSS